MGETGAEEHGPDTVVFDLRGDDTPPGSRSPVPKHKSARAGYVRRTRAALSVLAGVLAVACGLALYLWVQLESERSGRTTAVAANVAMEDRLEAARAELAAVEERLTEAEARLADTEQAASDSRTEVDRLTEEVAAVETELEAARSTLDSAEERTQELASVVVRSLNFLAGCVRAQGAVVDELEDRNPGRGQVRQLADHALEVCQDALDSLEEASAPAEDALGR